MRIIVLSDNKSYRQGLLAKHSLSLLVEIGFLKVLFGMGVDYHVIEHNARELDVDLATIDYVVVSHEHTPHYGGYRYVAQESPYTPTLIPYGSGESLGAMLRQYGLKPIEVRTWTRLSEGVYVTPPFYGPPYEHYLVVNHSRGLVVFSGCMHPGTRVLEEIATIMSRRVYAIIGGFHLQNAPLDIVVQRATSIAEIVRPELIIPIHCSGRPFIEELKARGLNVVEAGAGVELLV